MEENGRHKLLILGVQFRLSSREMSLIMPGLNRLAHESELALEDISKQIDPARKSAARVPKKVIALQNYLLAPGHSGRRRLVLNFLQVSMCLWAVRATVKLAAQRRIHISVPGWKPASLALLRKLETIRKRAKRAAIKNDGQSFYAAAQRSWRSFAATSRRRAFKPKRRILNPGFMNYPKSILEQAMRITRDGLQKRGVAIPPDAQLKRLVRTGLRKARRTWNWPSVRAILTNDAAAELFVSFVQDKIARTTKLKK